MLKQRRSGIMLFLLLSAMSALVIGVQPVKAAATIYINPDGSVVPPETPIQRNGNTYTFLNNIAASMVVLKSNIVVDGAGHTLQGTGIDNGIELSSVTNVTVKNMTLTAFDYGIYVYNSSQITVVGNLLFDNSGGIWLNEATGSIVKQNLIKLNSFDGIYLWSSLNNTLSENNVENNTYGISPYYGSGNKIYHNNFVNNEYSVNPNDPVDLWDDDYPSGGNYWSDYNDTDFKKGPNQSMSGSDGIGDTSYTIDEYNVDHYPLMKPYAGSHDIGIADTAASKTFVGQGYNVSIVVRIVNYGEQQESFNVTVRANSTVLQNQRITVASRDSTIITVAWSTSGLISYDEYAISVNAESVPGETDATDNVLTDGTVTIVHVGDVNGDRKVDIQDLARVSGAFGSLRVNDPSDPRYGQYWHPTTCITCPHTPNADINDDGKVDIADLARTSSNFGWHQ